MLWVDKMNDEYRIATFVWQFWGLGFSYTGRKNCIYLYKQMNIQNQCIHTW